MLVSFLISSALATPSPMMEQRVILARAIDAFYRNDLTSSEIELSTIREGPLHAEVSFWYSEIHLRRGDFDEALESLREVGDSVSPWKIAIVEVEAQVGRGLSGTELGSALESAWVGGGGARRSFGVGACLAQHLVEAGNLSRAGEVLREIGGNPESILPEWLREACRDSTNLLAVPPYDGLTARAEVTLLGERWSWDLESGVLMTSEPQPETPCTMPVGYTLPLDTLDLSISCVGDEAWFVRHMGGDSTLVHVEGGQEYIIEIDGMVPSTVSARPWVYGTQLLLGGVSEGVPLVAIWDSDNGLRAIPTGAWALTSPKWID